MKIWNAKIRFLNLYGLLPAVGSRAPRTEDDEAQREKKTAGGGREKQDGGGGGERSRAKTGTRSGSDEVCQQHRKVDSPGSEQSVRPEQRARVPSLAHLRDELSSVCVCVGRLRHGDEGISDDDNFD